MVRHTNPSIHTYIHTYRNNSNNSDHPIIRTPPSRKKINYCIPSIRTHSFEIIIPISKHLHLAELEPGVAECLLAFDSLCGARTGVSLR